LSVEWWSGEEEAHGAGAEAFEKVMIFLLDVCK
jgi:hypothetical protein